MSLLKKVTKFANKGLKTYAKFQTGGLGGLAASAINKATMKKAKMVPMIPPAGGQTLFGLPVMQASLIGPAMAAGGRLIATAAPKLKSLAKAGAAAIGGSLVADMGASAIESIVVESRKKRKYRRINPGNIKALRRSVRRIHSAEKMFRQVLSVQGKHHGGIKPKKRRGKH